MEDKMEEILAQYPIQVTSRKRVRGAILLDTEQGQRLLRNVHGNRYRLEEEERIMEHLQSQGYQWTDQLVRTSKGELCAKDGSGDWWVLRKWHGGRECDMHERSQVCQAAGHLAKLHCMLSHAGMDLHEERQMQETDIAGQEMPLPKKTDQQAELQVQEIVASQEREKYQVKRVPLFVKRTRELKRVYNYIRAKRRKNEMELAILEEYPHYYRQAEEAAALENLQHNLTLLEDEGEKQGAVLHGSYNYHNVLFRGKDIITTSFGNAKVGVQIMDLYGFLRKAMEKNGWRVDWGIAMLDAYQAERRLSSEESHLLYTLLLFPEKYWKQCNFYYNGKKCWMSGKNYDKLIKIQKQEEKRMQFLQEMKAYLL